LAIDSRSLSLFLSLFDPFPFSMQPFEAASTASAPQDKNYLFDALIAQIHREPLRWRLLAIVGQAGDPTNDATIAWPEGREQVDVGTLTLERVERDDTSAARDINVVAPPPSAPPPARPSRRPEECGAKAVQDVGPGGWYTHRRSPRLQT
jgi:hypothetical protein